jgi:GT2 family glycosyltransferase/glycosyltransferase involved in cell wall biosynthesis
MVDPSLDRIVVINDQSDEFTTRYLRSLEGVELIENEVNQGFLGTANRGLLLSDSEFVCLLNSDTVVVDSRWLDKMVHYARSHPEVGVISPVSNEAVNLSIKMHPGADINLIARLVDQHSSAKYPDAVTVVGFCLFIKREVIERIGGFDEIFGKGYCEESDFHYRAQRAGFTCKVADNVFMFHAGEASFSGERNERYTRNRQIFDERWLDHYLADIETFNRKDELSYLRDADFTFKFKELYDQYDILFLLPSFETYGGVIVVADIVNELILSGIRANVVSFRQTAQRLEIDKYFEPLWIPADALMARCPRSKIFVATHHMTAFHAIGLARRDRSKCLYFIQDDERRFEEADHEIAKLSYEAIPNHIYVSRWLEETFSQRAHFHRVIQNGIYRDIFYPGRKAALEESTLNLTMMTRLDKKRGFLEGMAAINRILHEKTAYHHLVFHFFGNRLILPGELLTDQYTYYGVISRKRVGDLLRKTDIFIDPSHFQGFGLTALEAMSSGCACVMPREGGTGDFAEAMENAVFFEGGNVEDLYQKIRLLLDCAAFRGRLQKTATRLPDHLNVYTSVKAFVQVISDHQTIPELPQENSPVELKLKLIVHTRKLEEYQRQEAVHVRIMNELQLMSKNIEHYRDGCAAQKDRIQQLENRLAQVQSSKEA